jgi:putative ABC transport system permease protein
MGALWQDIQFGMRMLVRSRGLTVIAIIALALGIGANTAIFSIVNAVLVRPLPYPDPQRLVWLWETQPNLPHAPFSAGDFLDFQAQNRSFEQLAAFHPVSFTLTGRGDPERLRAMVVTPNYFSALGVQPVLGRSFLPSEGAFGAPRVALLTYGFWQSHFGGAANATSQTLVLDGKPVPIIGMLPASYRGSDSSDLAIYVNPVNTVPEVFSASADWERKLSTNHETHYLDLIGRLKPGVTVAQAEADINGIFDHLHQQYPATTGHSAKVRPLQERTTGPVRDTLLVLLGVVGLVLLIACANIANLLLARAVGRMKEIAIRTALGAGRLRIVRQLLTESMLLAISGGALGLGLAWGLVRLLVAASPEELPRVDEVNVDLRVLAFTFGISLLTGLLFGLGPALAATRQRLGTFLKEGGRGASTGRTHNRLRSLLVIGEVALSLVLLVGAGLLIRSFVRLLDVKPGFNPDRIVSMWVNFTSERYAQKGESARTLQEIFRRVQALPGVESAAFASDLPLQGEDTTTGIGSAEGHGPYERGQEPLVGLHAVSAGYFHAMGIPLLRGRELSESDTATSTQVVVINQKMADTIWPGENPLGRHIDIFGDQASEVVGVVGNALYNGFAEPAAAESYLAFPQRPWAYACLTIRTKGEAATLFSAVRSVVSEVDPQLPVHDMRPMEKVMAETLASQRLTLWLVGGFAALALVLAFVGIYGVMSYSVTERVHEIGVRIALGAQPGDVLRLVVGHGMLIAGVGLLIGGVAAFFATRAMAGLLFGVKPSDPLTYAAIAAVLGFAALAACYLPARRATAVDPLVALRHE